MNSYPQSLKKDIVVQNLEDETLIYNLKTNKALCLNETSALIWKMCDGKTSISEIAEKLGKKLKKPVNAELVWLAVDQLSKENLLENADRMPSDFAGLSRREVIRKVGFASVIALPMISAVVAPIAASAQSGGFGFGEACGDSSQCAAGNCVIPGGECCVPGATNIIDPFIPICRPPNPASTYNAECCSNNMARSPSADVACGALGGQQGFACLGFPPSP